MAGIWLQQSDLVNVLSTVMYSAIFADPTTGITNTDIVDAVIGRAEQEVMSWLVGQYGPDVANQQNLAGDLFLKGCALEYAYAYSFDRYPEYAKVEEGRADRYKRAEERMQRVLQSRQRPTSLPTQPANTSSTVISNVNSIISAGPDGQYNSGDF